MKIDGVEVPIGCWVLRVDVEIETKKHALFESAVLTNHPNQYDLISGPQQNQLNKLCGQFGDLAARSLDRWVRVMRWKANNYGIGRPEIRDNSTGWGTALLDSLTNWRVWCHSHAVMVGLCRPVSVQEWEGAAHALKEGIESPVFLDLLMDAAFYVDAGDIKRAIIDSAVAAESFIRSTIAARLPSQTSESVRKFLDEANIRQVMAKLFPDCLNDTEKKAFSKVNNKVQKLFDVRNQILHSGVMPAVTNEQIGSWMETVAILISITGEYHRPSFALVAMQCSKPWPE